MGITGGGMMDYKTRDGEPTTLYKLVHQEPDWAINRIAHANKEIESLRQQIDLHLAQIEQRDITTESLQADSDEWKRRARLVVTWVANQIPPGCSLHLDKYFLKDHPEAAKWFEK